ncbi:carbohydrate sulfotransferase 11-like isoform X2 [Amphiura filiformis]|uniref:carbohydrate sulfotransferase 11-like isoform X2 n=1 Tax=Amphiura filiformis TaxID=82378 RepID=UPI003B2249A2
MGDSNRRFICMSFCASFLLVMLFMMYMLGKSSDSLGNATYYATHIDTVMQHVWTNVKASYNLPHNKHIDENFVPAIEVTSCISSHLDNKTFLIEQEQIQISRKDSLRKACNRYHHDTDGPHVPKVPLLVEDYHLAYAQTAKIAGTSWDRVLLVLSHLANSTNSFSQSKSIDLTKVNIPTLGNYRQADRQVILRNFTTFMFSRHPFSRLLSAYNCKVGPDATEEHIKRGYYDHLRDKILKKHPTTIPGIPDFHGFVSYILENDYFSDPHWKENYKIVAPCDVPYDIVGHFETLPDDAKYILQSVGADCLVEFPSSKGSAATNSSHDDTLIKYYQTLSKELIERLYRKYRLDFLLFGYTFEITIDGQLMRFPPDS